MRFDGIGACVLNPHGNVISPSMHIHRYPTVERFGLVWIWMGKPEAASPNDIPNLSYMNALGMRTVHSYIKTTYRYDILVDNLLDLSHADYLHVGTFSGGLAERSDTQVRQQGNDVIVVRTQYSAPPPPRFRDLADRVDLSFTIHWHPGQVINFEWRGVPAGHDLANGRLLSRFAHIATPETDGSTHYFMSMTRDNDIDDPALDAQIARYQVTVVQNEDGAMLDAIDAEMKGANLMDLRPVVLPTDKGGLRVRHVMKHLLRQEGEQAESEHTARHSPPIPVAVK